MKILIIGGSSRIGSKILKEFMKNKIDVSYTYYQNKLNFGKGYKLDIRIKKDTINLISKIVPDVVIHASSLTNVDLCEKNEKLANSINVEGTKNVVLGCKKNGCKIVYISTSFVFSGKKEEYYENDKRFPSSKYGIAKCKAEDIVKKSNLEYLILRTDQPYDWIEPKQKDNSVTRVLAKLTDKSGFNEVTDWKNVPTYIPDFVKALKKLLKLEMTGVFHVCGPEFISRYDWSIKTAEIFGFEKKQIHPINSKELNLPTKRVNVNLSSKKLEKITKIEMNGIIKGLKLMRKKKSS